MKQIVKKYMDCDNRKTTANHFLFSLNFSMPPKKNNYMLAILYKTLTISMIHLELAVVFLLSQSMYFLTMVMVICLSIVIDDLVTWNTWFAINYVFGITQIFFLFILFIIIIIIIFM
jgi:hypothetical protein